MIQPEVTPTAIAKAVTTGNISAAASTRGTTRYDVAVVGQGLERVHLLGDLHRAELGGDARAHAAGERHAR